MVEHLLLSNPDPTSGRRPDKGSTRTSGLMNGRENERRAVTRPLSALLGIGGFRGDAAATLFGCVTDMNTLVQTREADAAIWRCRRIASGDWCSAMGLCQIDLLSRPKYSALSGL